MPIRYSLLLVTILTLPSAHATSRLPPKTPLMIEQQHVVVDLQPLLDETNNVEITRVFLCRRNGSQCYQHVWEIDLPKGWRDRRLELLGEYSGSTVETRLLEGLQVGGSYNLGIFFNERSRWHKQTVSSIYLEFCLTGEPDNWQLLDDTACLARRNAENQQGATP